MNASGRKALGALFIALIVPPLQAVVISNVPTCTLCSELPGDIAGESSQFTLEAGLVSLVLALDTRTTGYFEIDDTWLALRALGGTLTLEAGIVVPANRRPSSALQGVLFDSTPCADCAGTQVTTERSKGIHMGLPFIAILGVVLIAVAVPFFYFVRRLRSLNVEQAYLKERWGVRSRME